MHPPVDSARLIYSWGHRGLGAENSARWSWDSSIIEFLYDRRDNYWKGLGKWEVTVWGSLLQETRSNILETEATAFRGKRRTCFPD
jgi:hypothetical protein